MLTAVCLLSLATTTTMSRGMQGHVLPLDANNDNDNEGEQEIALKWKDINMSLPQNTSHQVVGYDAEQDRVYLLGGKNVENEYWTLQFSEPDGGWTANEKTNFEKLKIMEYQQSYFSSRHNIVYIKTGGYIHIFDLALYYFNENVIELPVHLMDGCLTVYYDSDADIEYLIIIGNKLQERPSEPTTWIYKVNAATHNITFFDIGPDLLGIRENFCCTVMDDYLYVLGGVYDAMQTRFVEQWHIDIDTAYVEDAQGDVPGFDNFTNVNTLINTDIANYHLPQYGHRCLVNTEKQHLYVVGGITEEIDARFNYSEYVLVIRRENDTLFEINYTEKGDERQNATQSNDTAAAARLAVAAKVLPSLPVPMAYSAVMMDQYGYLNVFGGEVDPDTSINKWYRVSTRDEELDAQDQIDIIWKSHKKHNHNEQWAILILLLMIVLVGIWFKCVSAISKLKNGAVSLIAKRKGRGWFTDGTVYDEVTATSEPDLEDMDPNGRDLDDDNVVTNGPSSGDENQYINGIMANVDHLEQVQDEDVEHNAEVVA